MRFIILVKATQDSEAGIMPTDESLWEEMSRYHQELARAGALLDASGLQPSSKGWRIRFDGDRRTVVDGPFTEAKELIAGYTIIQVSSREEALEWTRRFPNPGAREGEIEVRRLFDLDDLEQRPEIERFREMGLPSQQ
jgi:hypothetical protein